MNRSMKYELYNIKNYNLGLMGVCLIVLVGLYMGNVFFMDNYTALGQSKEMLVGTEMKIGVSMVQTLLLGIGIMIIASTFSFIYRSLPINISMSITRKEFFKTILFQNIVSCLILSIFMGLLLKLEPFFIGKVLETRPSYVYLSQLGNIDILNNSILLIILNVFLVFLAVMSMWTTISLLMYVFRGYIFLLIIGGNIILENFYIKNNRFLLFIKSVLEFISIDSLIDGAENLPKLIIGTLVFISIFYGIIYFILKLTKVRGE